MSNWLGWSEKDVAAYIERNCKHPGRIVRVLDKEPVKQVRPAKYRAKPTVTDGIKFASKKEAKRYAELLLLRKAGKIIDLKLQPRIRCVINGEHVCDYIADFFYVDRQQMRERYEDCKGFKTPVYRLKRKIVKACTGIEILET